MLLVSFHSAVGDSADLRQRLSPEDFERAGLSKLDEAELSHLASLVSEWVESEAEEAREIGLAGPPGGEEGFGMEAITERVAAIFQSQSPDQIESRISGTFDGWRGNTLFELENGQVWRQSERDQFIVRLENPAVVIRRAAMGSYLLKIEGYNSSVRVKRVK